LDCPAKITTWTTVGDGDGEGIVEVGVLVTFELVESNHNEVDDTTPHPCWRYHHHDDVMMMIVLVIIIASPYKQQQ
jgi:hypothetical protein